jgi:hypothetical protein
MVSTAAYEPSAAVPLGCVLTGPWAMPLTAGTMKIERGVVYNPKIHHGNFLQNNSSSWAPTGP